MLQQNISVGSLVDMYKRGELRLPEIQRQYVWRVPRVRDLLDSLYRGYPSGTVLLWETDERVPLRTSAIQQDESVFAGRKLLLDGQQRITSLTAVLRGEPIVVRGRIKPIQIAFNLDHPEGPPTEITEVEGDEDSPLADQEDMDEEDNGDEAGPGSDVDLQYLRRQTFTLATRSLLAQSNWVAVNKVFVATDAEILRAAGVTSLDDPRYQRYSERLKRLRAIKDYTYGVHVLERGLSYEEVTEIFVRVNSLGAKLRSSDLALAQLTSRWPDLLKDLEQFQAECEQSWFTIDLGQLVRSMVVFATQQCKFGVVGSTPIVALKAGWQEGKEGLRFAINFLRANAGVEDESLLSSPMFLHVLAAVSRVKGNRISAEEQQQLLRWLLIGNARGRFGRGASEGLLNEDLAAVFRRKDLFGLVEGLRRQFGRLHVDAVDLVGRGSSSPFLALAYLALKHAGAKDWHSGLGLSLAHQGRLHFIQRHHIFPKSLLKAYGYELAEINEIANMGFITGQTNRRISNRPAHEYLAEVAAEQGVSTLTSQCVPLDRDLWRIDRYREFLQFRREALASAMNAFVDDKAGALR